MSDIQEKKLSELIIDEADLKKYYKDLDAQQKELAEDLDRMIDEQKGQLSKELEELNNFDIALFDQNEMACSMDQAGIVENTANGEGKKSGRIKKASRQEKGIGQPC